MSVHIVGFAGSLRKGSLNRALLRAAKDLAPDGSTFEIAELEEVPLFNGDLITQVGSEPVYPPSVTPLRAAIGRADALFVVSPEYNFSMPAVTKNALDWASRSPSVLDGKAVAFTGASPGGMGTVRGQMALRHVCVFTNMFAVNKPEVFVSKATDKFDKEMNLTDEPTKESLKKLLASLVDLATRLRR